MCCTALCCTVPCCTELCYTVLHGVALYLLFGVILIVLCYVNCTVLYCAVLTHTVVWYVVLYCRKRTWPLVPVNILVVSMRDDPVIKRILLPRLFFGALYENPRGSPTWLITFCFCLHTCVCWIGLSFNLMFFMLIILFMDKLNKSILFVFSHVVTEMVISLQYLLTNKRLDIFFYITMDFYLYISTTNIQILVNRSKSTYETFCR